MLMVCLFVRRLYLLQQICFAIEKIVYDLIVFASYTIPGRLDSCDSWQPCLRDDSLPGPETEDPAAARPTVEAPG